MTRLRWAGSRSSSGSSSPRASPKRASSSSSTRAASFSHRRPVPRNPVTSRVRAAAASAAIFVPSIATCSNLPNPALTHRASTLSNNSSTTASLSLRNRAIVTWSG